MVDPASPAPASLRALFAAALRGDPAPWSWDEPDARGRAAIADALRYEGVAGLLAAAEGAIAGWPAAARAEVQALAMAEAMWELRHRDLLAALVDRLGEAGIPALLMKGSALAYSLYESPAARPRSDSDLLVAPADLDQVRAILDELGFAFAAGEPWQESWALRGAEGNAHVIDLHWAVFNAAALADVLPLAECFAAARGLPRLAAAARSLDPVHLLLHAAVHRALHRTAPYRVGSVDHFGGERLIWSADIARLAASLGADEWQALVALAVSRRVAGSLADGLVAAAIDCRASVPADVLDRLEGARADDRAYLRRHTALARVIEELRATRGLAGKARMVAGRLLPDAGFLRAKYPAQAHWPLPLLHFRRIVGALQRRGA